MTLSFNLGGRGACRWCWSTSSIHIPALKFLGLTVRKIWPYLCVCVSRPVTLTFDLWPFDPETGAQCSTCHRVPSCRFWWYCDCSLSICRPLGQHGSDRSRDLVTLTLSLEVTAPVADAGRRSPSFTEFEVRRPCCSEDLVHDVCQH